MAKGKISVVVFASGFGTNAENIFQYAKNNSEKIEVLSLITDNSDAPVIQRAIKYQIPHEIVPFVREGFSNYNHARRDQEQKIEQILHELPKVDWILLAGYMRIISKYFLDNFRSKVINIHPSLLPSFKGKDAYLDSFNYGVKVAGVTIHFVCPEVDAGPIILQESFPRHDNDSFEDFKARGMEIEYSLYRKLLDNLCQNKLVKIC